MVDCPGSAEDAQPGVSERVARFIKKYKLETKASQGGLGVPARHAPAAAGGAYWLLFLGPKSAPGCAGGSACVDCWEGRAATVVGMLEEVQRLVP